MKSVAQIAAAVRWLEGKSSADRPMEEYLVICAARDALLWALGRACNSSVGDVLDKAAKSAVIPENN